ncbi:DUF881 domain-containing protein [Brevibacterium ihuae]|uniref:DUF881 domain-containing protein n=1 Tax=Brevibacterium ihuae TaxID=1631743 RepID=UPI0015E11ACF|nr:DUF881 domain-containing protein [Brevibacterium ihuae]
MTAIAQRTAVFVVLVLCGILMATSARLSDGTHLRNETSSLPDIVQERSRTNEDLQQRITERRASIEQLEERAADGDVRVEDARAAADELATAASTTALEGTGLTVTLDDAPPESAGIDGASPNDLIIHQQDLEGVMNALWAGGARGMSVQGQRIVSTSAVKCVGNTLRVNARVFSPPYTVEVVGDPEQLREALDASPAVTVFRSYSDRLGLGWKVETGPVTLTEYTDSLEVDQAKVKQ